MLKQSLLTLCCALAPLAGHAELLQFAFSDALNDQMHPNAADLQSVHVLFDNNVGDYVITLTSSAEHPFSARVNVNANFLNPDTPTFTVEPSYFFDNLNDLVLDAPTTTLILTGTNPNLLAWQAGDRVASSSFPFGLAIDSLEKGQGPFLSNITDMSDLSNMSHDFFPTDLSATISVVPEPETLALLLAGIGIGAAMRRPARPGSGRPGSGRATRPRSPTGERSA